MLEPVVDLSAFPSRQAFKSNQIDLCLQLVDKDLISCANDQERVMLTFLKGNALLINRRFRLAIIEYQHVLEMAHHIVSVLDRSRLLNACHANLGISYEALGLFELALEHLQTVREVSETATRPPIGNWMVSLYQLTDDQGKTRLLDEMTDAWKAAPSDHVGVIYAKCLVLADEYSQARKVLLSLTVRDQTLQPDRDFLLFRTAVELGLKRESRHYYQLFQQRYQESRTSVHQYNNNHYLAAVLIIDYLLRQQDYDGAEAIIADLNRAQLDFRSRQYLQEVLAKHRRPMPIEKPITFHGMIGHSVVITRLFQTIQEVGGSVLGVLLQGPTGSGKELVARSIHNNSPRINQPFVAVNVPGVPDSLFESQFFGHVKGAFTGAIHDHAGYIQQADGGTLFLDELGDMTLPMQAKLLRFLDSGEYTPVGGKRTLRADVRLVSASNQSIMDLVSREKFRADLYYRLAQRTLTVPALAERREDIPALARYFLFQNNIMLEKNLLLTDEALDFLQKCDFPGNIRQLRNIVYTACALQGIREITPEILQRVAPGALAGQVSARPTLREYLAEKEKLFIADSLFHHGGDIQATADELGVNRNTLQRKIRNFSISIKSESSNENT